MRKLLIKLKNIKFWNKTVAIALVIIVIAGVLGYLTWTQRIFQHRYDNNSSDFFSEFNNLSDKEKAVKILNFNFSPEQFGDWLTVASSLAQKTDRLNISGCKPEPLILKLNSKEQLTVVNNDPIEHSLIFPSLKVDVDIVRESAASGKKVDPLEFFSEDIYKISPQSTQILPISTDLVSQKYKCDNSQDAVGIIVLNFEK